MKVSFILKLTHVALLLVISCLTFAAYSQTVKGWEVVPPSPDAAALGKYGNTPVGMFTGTPEISIPLYTVKTKKLELPISMSYHASGFRVSELAPWTGLGWTLNAGGLITRSAVGLGDDSGGGFLYNNNNQSASEIDQNDLQWLIQVSNGIADNESDFYFYNFAGRSGKFVFDDNRQPFLVPKEPIKITFSTTTNSFKVVLEDGTVYRFNKREIIESGAQTPLGNDSHTYTGAYYLTSMKSADGTDSITFSYANDGYYTELNTNYSETIGSKCERIDLPFGEVTYATIPVQHDFNTSFNFRTVNDIIRLSEITFFNGKIEFVRTAGRLDGGNSSLTEIRIKKLNSTGTFDLQKSFKLEFGYFGSYDHARLKLNVIGEYDATNTFIKGHEFFYNESMVLPSRGSTGQDWWGFYNGGGGTTLVPKELINFQGHIYHVGAASRKPSALHMQACILSRVKYPTGGYTEFEYEPHYYDGTSTIPMDISASSGAMNNTTDLLQDTKTFTTNRDGYALVRAHCSNSVVSALGGNPYFSKVTFRKIGGSTLVDHTYDPYPLGPSGQFDPENVQEYFVLLSPGTYEIKVSSQGTSTSMYYNGGAFSKATVFWEDFAPAGTPVMAGGLRVKETRDYDSPGAVPVTQIYKYGTNEDGKGLLITPENKLSSYKEEKAVRFWDTPPWNSLCHITCESTRKFIYGNTPHDLTSFNGSSVIYPEVTVYQKSLSSPNGKSVHKFQVEPDEIYPAGQGYRDGVILVDNSWKVSDLISSVDFVGNTTNKAREVTNTHPPIGESSIYSTKIGKKNADVGLCGPAYLPTDIYNSFYYFDYPIRSGIKKITSSTEKIYSTTDPSKFNTIGVTYTYGNLNNNHQQLTQRNTTDSEGNSVITKYWYPADYTSVDTISTLLNKNIINKPIKEETTRNGLLISGTASRLNTDGEVVKLYQHESTSPQAPPVHSSSVRVPAGYVKKLDISYDASTKNISRVQALDDVNTSYLWAYNNSYPIAKAINAMGDIAATSFESDGKGNWTYAGATYNDILVKTGTYYYKLGGGNITKSLPAGKYKLEYWAKGTVNLAGGTITNIRTSVADAAGWILYEKEVTISATTTLTLSGTSTAFIDELRLYPVSAQMTTYTYDRLNGITSVNDPANSITYYEYDTAGRLKWLKDNDNNIVKSLEYRYKIK